MRVIGVHIPKAGGMSLREHLERIFGEDRVFYDYNHVDRPGSPETPIPGHILARLRRPEKTTCVYGHFKLSRYRHVPAAIRMV
jgi:hypothetical protein